MAWYNSGTVKLTTGSATVTGTNTAWADNKMGIGPGQMFLVPGSGVVQMYEILRVDSNTQITLRTNFTGSNAENSAYSIPSFYTDSIPDFARRLSAQLSYYQSQMDGWQQIMTGSGTVSITAPDDMVVNISSFKKLTDDMALKANKSDLGTAANKNIGVGSGQIPDMSTFMSLRASNGWQRLPSGLIIQWASFVPGLGSGAFNPSYPIPFPNAPLQLCVTVYDDFNSSAIVWRRTSNNQKTNWQVGLSGGNQYLSIEMIAIGY